MLIFSYFLVPQTSGCSQRSAGTPRLCHHSRQQAEIRPQGKQNMAGTSTRWDFQWCLIAEGYIKRVFIWMILIKIVYTITVVNLKERDFGVVRLSILHCDMVVMSFAMIGVCQTIHTKGKHVHLTWLTSCLSIYLSVCLSVYLSIYPSISCNWKKKWWVALDLRGFGHGKVYGISWTTKIYMGISMDLAVCHCRFHPMGTTNDWFPTGGILAKPSRNPLI